MHISSKKTKTRALVCSLGAMEAPSMATMDFSVPLPPMQQGRVLTVLSIDGGGIRGLIPATILERLEAELQVRVCRHILLLVYVPPNCCLIYSSFLLLHCLC